ncbi:unnamed protein product [Acanthoscelides obtectus]|uniref:Uncharacterized protein n=2 Tax=Acanthoscelides obtectus TaxID=200917 RepID=A0A9P0K3Y3_ACAOB|nr:unnamed protein product [Acanthoscelides obtectus]CAK1665926.1 hypothetical protein AOBTE_LOCUS25052 [Acanthoscelides obtectus]
MKVVAVPQLLLLTAAAVSAAPPLSNHERSICAHRASQANPMELRQDDPDRLILDYSENLDHNSDRELKLEENGEQRYHHINRAGYVGFLQPDYNDDLYKYEDNRPLSVPCHKHTGQTFNPFGDQDGPLFEHEMVHKRQAEFSSTIASSQLDVLDPVDKVYDAPVPELKGGVRKRAAEEKTTPEKEDGIKYVPPPEDMPVSEDQEQTTANPEESGAHETRSPGVDDPKRADSVSKPNEKDVRKKRSAVDSEPAPQEHASGEEQAAKSGESNDEPKSEDAAPEGDPKKGGVRKRSTENETHHTEEKDVGIDKSFQKDAANRSAGQDDEAQAKLAASEPKVPEGDETSTQGDEASATTEASTEESVTVSEVPKEKRSAEQDDVNGDDPETTTESKKEYARRRRSAEDDQTSTLSDESATSAPKQNRSPETYQDPEKDSSESTVEPEKESRRRRRYSEDQEDPTDSKAGSEDESGSVTSVPKEKRFAEHQEPHDDVKEDAPESSTTEPAAPETKKEETHTRQAVQEDLQASEGAATTLVPKEKRSAENEDVPETSTPEAMEGSTKKCVRRRRDAADKESSISPSSDKDALTSAPKDEQFTEHEDTHEAAGKNAPRQDTDDGENVELGKGSTNEEDSTKPIEKKARRAAQDSSEEQVLYAEDTKTGGDRKRSPMYNVEALETEGPCCKDETYFNYRN